MQSHIPWFYIKPLTLSRVSAYSVENSTGLKNKNTLSLKNSNVEQSPCVFKISQYTFWQESLRSFLLAKKMSYLRGGKNEAPDY